MTKTAQEKRIGKDTGKWLVDLCLMPDPGDGRGAPNKDPSSILYPDPGLSTYCRKRDQVLSTIGSSDGDHRAGKPKTFHRKEVLGATASTSFLAERAS